MQSFSDAYAKEYPELDPILQRAGGLDEFLADSNSALMLREGYLRQLQDYYGKERFTGRHFDQLLDQLRGFDRHIQGARQREALSVEIQRIKSILNGPDWDEKVDLVSAFEERPPSDPKVFQTWVEDGLPQPDPDLQKRVGKILLVHGRKYLDVHASLQKLLFDHPESLAASSKSLTRGHTRAPPGAE